MIFLSFYQSHYTQSRSAINPPKMNPFITVLNLVETQKVLYRVSINPTIYSCVWTWLMILGLSVVFMRPTLSLCFFIPKYPHCSCTTDILTWYVAGELCAKINGSQLWDFQSFYFCYMDPVESCGAWDCVHEFTFCFFMPKYVPDFAYIRHVSAQAKHGGFACTI